VNREEEKKLEAILKGNASYRENKENWEFLYDSYVGGLQFADGEYLSKHTNETESDFNDRKKLSAYTNFVEPLVRLYSSYIFKSDIRRDVNGGAVYSTAIEEIKNDFNLEDMDSNDFMETLSKMTMVFGRMIVVVDVPFFEGTKSLEQSINDNTLPYCKMYPPTSVVNFKLSPPGLGKRELEMLVLKEGEGDDDETEYFKIWTKQDWMLISKTKDKKNKKSKLAIVKTGENRIGKIPAINIVYKSDMSADFDSGISFIEDISVLSKKIYNLDSAAYEIVERVGFPMLQGPATPGDSSDVTIGTGNVLLYDAMSGNGAKFEYLEPINTSLREILYWRNQVEQDIRNISHTVGVSMEKEAESGAALEARLQGLHSNLGSMSKKLEKTEKSIYDLIGLYLNTNLDLKIVYPKTFNIRDLSLDIDNAIKAKSFLDTPFFNEQLEETMTVKVLSNIQTDDSLSDDDKERMRTEIDAKYNIDETTEDDAIEGDKNKNETNITKTSIDTNKNDVNS